MQSRARSDFPEVPPELQSRNILRYLKFYGPGAILASVTIGTGETVFASRGGAIFGYALLWCFVWGALLKGVMTYSALRFITLTGRHPVVCWIQIPGPKGWFPWIIALASTMTLIVVVSAIPKFLATLFAASLGLSPTGPDYRFLLNAIATAVLVVCALLALGSSYRTLEATQTAIVVIFLTFVVAAFVSFRPGILVILKHLVVPVVPSYPDWMYEAYPSIVRRSSWVEVMTYLGLIGGSSADYLGYLSFAREKGWGRAGLGEPGGRLSGSLPDPSPEDVQRGRWWLRAPLADIVISFGIMVVFTSMFVILGAVILAPMHQVPHDQAVLTVQANFLTKLHPYLSPIYFLGIVMVFLGTLYGAFELQARAIHACTEAIAPSVARRVPPSRVRLALVVFGGVTGTLLIWTNWDPIAIITPASILAGVLTCGLWCFAMVWTDVNYLPRVFQMKAPLRALVLLAGVIMTTLGMRAMYDYVRGLL